MHFYQYNAVILKLKIKRLLAIWDEGRNMTSLNNVYPTLTKGRWRVQLPPVIVLQLWLYTEQPDISQGKVANTATDSLKWTEHPLDGEYWLNEAFSTNLCCHRVLSLMWQYWWVKKINKNNNNNRYEVWILYAQSMKSKMQNNLQRATMSGLKKQRWRRKLLFTQYTEMAAVDVPLKMSQWTRENECAPAGQMSLNIPMKMVFASWIQLLHNWT